MLQHLMALLIPSFEDLMKVPYSTKDISTAAFLWCHPGACLEKTTEIEGSMYFHFQIDLKGEEELNSLLFAYSNRRTSVEPVLFFENAHKLRQMVRDSNKTRRR